MGCGFCAGWVRDIVFYIHLTVVKDDSDKEDEFIPLYYVIGSRFCPW